MRPCPKCGAVQWVSLPPTKFGFKRIACAGKGDKPTFPGQDGENLACGYAVAL